MFDKVANGEISEETLKKAADGELTEEELEAVAGGIITLLVGWGIAMICIGALVWINNKTGGGLCGREIEWY